MLSSLTGGALEHSFAGARIRRCDGAKLVHGAQSPACECARRAGRRLLDCSCISNANELAHALTTRQYRESFWKLLHAENAADAGDYAARGEEGPYV